MRSPVKIEPTALVSLHDVAPVHLDRLRKAEALFRELGAPAVQYLFVPDFHRRSPAWESPAFLDWCRAPRPFEVSWWLHGYTHLDDAGGAGASSAAPLGLVDRLRRRHLTGGEGEFLALDAGEQRRRLEAGLARFSECFPGRRPRGFVAPAWLFRPEVLLPLLRELGIPCTEDHHRLHFLDGPAPCAVRAPVVTWATRTFLRRQGSLLVCPLREQWFRREPLLRVALHPHDFDHPATIASIRGVLRRVLRRRRSAVPEALDRGTLCPDPP